MNRTKEEIAEDGALAVDVNAIVAAMLSSFDVKVEIDIVTGNKIEEGVCK